jgi:hypothetical protein
MIEDCSVTNNMQRAARRMTEQPMKLIGIILAKHQEAILEVCKEQQEKIERLEKKLQITTDALMHFATMDQLLVVSGMSRDALEKVIND